MIEQFLEEKVGSTGHLSNLQRAMHLKEFLGIGTDYDELVNQEKELFDFDDWYIETMYATDEYKQYMEQENLVASITAKPEFKRATIYFHEEKMKDDKILPQAVVDHELAHLIINPYDSTGVFNTGGELEEIQTIHISFACRMLREQPEEFKIENPENLEEIFAKAKKLTRLDENNWQIRIEEKENIEIEDERLPVFATSLFYENHAHLALLSARQIVLEIDRKYLEENNYCLSYEVAKALWRVVLNPYDKPNLGRIQERKLNQIMRIMEKLGWPGEKDEERKKAGNLGADFQHKLDLYNRQTEI